MPHHTSPYMGTGTPSPASAGPTHSIHHERAHTTTNDDDASHVEERPNPKLTERMAQVLTDMRRNPLRRPHKPGPGKPLWPAHHATLAALERHGLAKRDLLRNRKGWKVDTWTITNHGRTTLATWENPPIRPASTKPRYLQRDVWRGGDYTTDPRHAIDNLEVIDPTTIDRAPARRRHAKDQDRRSRANKLARRIR